MKELGSFTKRKKNKFVPFFSLVFVLAFFLITTIISETRWLHSYHRFTTSTGIIFHNDANIISNHGAFLTANEEYALQYYMYKRRTDLLRNSSNVVDFMAIYNFFIESSDSLQLEPWKSVSEANESAREELLQPMSNLSGSNLIYAELCSAIKAFNATGGIKRHVLMYHFNENWGGFSDPIPNRTVDWGKWLGHFLGETTCDMDDFWWYLNHTNLSAIFTVQHQWLDHPKIFSIPLGAKIPNSFIDEVHEPFSNRSNLLLIAQSDFNGRPAIAKRVIANFNGTIKNRYHEEGTNFFDLLRDSKFHLCPSGFGIESYRNYETIALGTIPIMEKTSRRDGWYRTFDMLPALWVDHFDNVTPALLEEQYPKILSRAREYEFERLTQQWWIDLIYRYRFDPPPQVKEVEWQMPPVRMRRR